MPPRRNLSLLSVKSGRAKHGGKPAQTRVEQDAAELGNNAIPLDLPVALPGVDKAAQIDGLMDNEPGRTWAEVAVTAASLSTVVLMYLPYNLKKGRAWYTVCWSLVLFSTVVSLACVFFGNTHVKLLKFLAVNGVFWQVLVLVVVDWVIVIVWGCSSYPAYDTQLIVQIPQ